MEGKKGTAGGEGVTAGVSGAGDEGKNPGICQNRHCGKTMDERCGNDYCRECHVSLSFEDCVSGEWVRRTRAAAGLYT